MKRKNIVIAPCGNKSFLFRQSWLKDNDKREFDICLLFYHDEIADPLLYHDVDYFFHLKDFKYRMIYDLLTNLKPEWLNEYEYFYFLDDDIDIETDAINELFALNKAFKASLSCAALSHDSFCSWPIFKQAEACFLRYVGQIEVMAPVIHNETLNILLPTFIENRSSWGYDSVWAKLLNYSRTKMIIFDSVVMKHTLPVGGGELYIKIGVDPHMEWKDIVDKYGALPENYREYGRLKLLTTDNNLKYKISNSFNQGIANVTRKIRDYDLKSRIKHRFSKA